MCGHGGDFWSVYLLLLTVPVLLALPKPGVNHQVSDVKTKPQRVPQRMVRTDKKGTIRIAGPWHSDSALDRNIDPGEDSYVKKIISSNEGINFNKDMAEAGEVFDVNGIEDFYDKNAMITYEINGHEIPVHLRPKYTPQSKPMFPEYVKELPGAIGQTKNHLKASEAETGHHIREPEHKTRFTTFSGLTLSEMPEYKLHDSPSFDEKGSSRLSSTASHSREGLKKIAMLRRYLQLKKDLAKSGDREDRRLPLKSDSIRSSRPYATTDVIPEDSGKVVPFTVKRPQKYHQGDVQEASEDGWDKLRDSSKAERLEEAYPRHSKLIRAGSDDVHSFGEDRHSRDQEEKYFSKETKPDHEKETEYNPSIEESSDIQEKGMMETPSLSQHLEDMHQERESADQQPDALTKRPLSVEPHYTSNEGAAIEEPTKEDGSNPDKSKVKEKILSLLGELTNRLKGKDKTSDSEDAVAKSKQPENDDREDEEKSPSEVKLNLKIEDSIDDASRSHVSDETDSLHGGSDREKFESDDKGEKRTSYDHDKHSSTEDENSDFHSELKYRKLNHDVKEDGHDGLDPENERLPDDEHAHHHHRSFKEEHEKYSRQYNDETHSKSRHLSESKDRSTTRPE